jgi:DNA repair photolyase
VRLRVIDNPPNPYLSQHVEWLEPPPLARVEVFEETSGSILSENDSPDLPFRWSANPYRGCQHACAYCYARPYHEYLGFGAGTDFDTKIVVKTNAAALLRKTFAKKSWRRESVNFSGVTDCYQPLEASYRITRACLEAGVDFRNPVGIVTKGFLVVRDIDVLTKLHRVAGVKVFLSIPFATDEPARLIEPQASPPSRRFEALRRLREAGIPAGVMVAPIIPGLNDSDIPSILRQAQAAGACWAHPLLLRLPRHVRDVFIARLHEAMPLRAGRVLSLLRDARGGAVSSGRFHERMRGEGPQWETTMRMFEVAAKRAGLGRTKAEASCSTSAASADGDRAKAPQQLELPF